MIDHYAFVWRDGRMALALGLGKHKHTVIRDVSCSLNAYTTLLGSLFNHAQRPNVSYTIDPATDSIHYTTSRRIYPDEELCIFYGHELWFDPLDVADGVLAEAVEERDDGWGGLCGVGDDENVSDISGLSLFDGFVEGDPDRLVPEEELPFRRLKLTPDEEEEDMDSVRKGTSVSDRPKMYLTAAAEEAWVVDLPNPRLAATMLKCVPLPAPHTLR